MNFVRHHDYPDKRVYNLLMKKSDTSFIYSVFFWVAACVIPAAVLLWPAPVAAADIISEVSIRMETDASGTEKYAELARNLIAIKAGDSLDPDLLKKSLDALTRSRVFETVHVDTPDKDGRVTLLFRLKPFRLVREIDIHGAFPLFEKDILNAMTLTVGDRFSEDVLPRETEAITALLTREGYTTPEVELSAEDVLSEKRRDPTGPS